MVETLDDSAQKHLELVAARETCDWCKYPDKQIYRGGLCRRCDGIKAELKHLHKEVQERMARGDVHPKFGLGALEFDYVTATYMAEAAQSEGRMYGSLCNREVTPLDLEHEFSFISKRFLKKDVYRNSVDLYTYFTLPQRRLLKYIVSRLARDELRRNRRNLARFEAQGRTIEQALNERFPGTYRVEEDATIDRGT
jgi:hypothetical protein